MPLGSVGTRAGSASLRRSRNSPKQSDRGPCTGLTRPSIPQRNGAIRVTKFRVDRWVNQPSRHSDRRAVVDLSDCQFDAVVKNVLISLGCTSPLVIGLITLAAVIDSWRKPAEKML